jgi:hypothetical protein
MMKSEGEEEDNTKPIDRGTSLGYNETANRRTSYLGERVQYNLVLVIQQTLLCRAVYRHN